MKDKKKDSPNTPTALYRKYRPTTFKDVLGQDHIVKVLEGAIKLGNISHAYLFAGSRGTGKTSIARIFAEEIGTRGNDLYEIDAASNRGIDDVREIRESVQTLPFESKYKVYIIDEAHMLTKEAWNAFLKTLEEPPAYVVFILATTELEKVPETVLSRCQTFQFKKPTLEILKDVVLNITKNEGRVLEPSSAELIALLGDGSFRDTEGILDKVLSFSAEKKISAEEVALITGAPRGDLVNSFVHGEEYGHRSTYQNLQ
jgi:DNA polymerase-3 subunit gamma/tau